jgi:hypothetical protein
LTMFLQFCRISLSRLRNAFDVIVSHTIHLESAKSRFPVVRARHLGQRGPVFLSERTNP